MGKKTCLVICPIGNDGEKTRENSDKLLNLIIRPVLEELGFEKPIRADEINASGTISNQIVTMLFDFDLVIADLSNYNPNVFYELAIRHFIKKPVIHMITNGQDIPFDVSGMRTIFYNFELEKGNDAISKLKQQIENMDTIEADNPITTASGYRNMFGSLHGTESGLNDSDLLFKALERFENKLISTLSEMRNLSIDPNLERIERMEYKLMAEALENEIMDIRLKIEVLEKEGADSDEIELLEMRKEMLQHELNEQMHGRSFKLIRSKKGLRL